VIVPLKLNFVAAGHDTSAIDALYYPGYHATPLTKSFDGGTRVADVLNSPIFKSFTYPADMGADSGWFSAKLQNLTNALQIDATTGADLPD
jgi:hypothetical protein